MNIIKENTYTKEDIKQLEKEHLQMITQRKRLDLSGITFKNLMPVKKLKRIKPVAKLSVEGEVLERYRSINQAAKKNKLSSQMIWMCCNGYRKRAKGFKWIYVN